MLFDLDGTLTDSAPGVTGSMAHTLGRLGYPVPPVHELWTLVGPPLESNFRRLTGQDGAELQHAIDTYREHYGTTGLLGSEPFAGIGDLLDDLRADGRALAVASSKSVEFVERILANTGLLPFFDVVAGARENGRLSDKAVVVTEALDRLATLGHDVTGAVLVGDREHDVIGARARGIGCIFVTWGYGDAAEATGADAVATSPEQLAGLLGVRPRSRA